MLTRYEVEGDTLVLLDSDGNQIGDAYSLSPLQDPREVAAWLAKQRAALSNRPRHQHGTL